MEELRRVINFRNEQLRIDTGLPPPPFLGLALSSRRNLCVHEKVWDVKDGAKVDALCHAMTASHVRDQAASGSSRSVSVSSL